MNMTNAEYNDDLIWVDPEVYERIIKHPEGIYIEAQCQPMLKLKVIGWEPTSNPMDADKTTCKQYKPYMDTLKLLCERFYEFDGCICGGPLHVLLDDDNYDIHTVQFCIDYCTKDLKAEKPEYPAHVNLLGIMIANEYAKMSIEERAVFDSYWNGVPVPSYDCPGNCMDCDICGQDGVYDYMREAEEEI